MKDEQLVPSLPFRVVMKGLQILQDKCETMHAAQYLLETVPRQRVIMGSQA